MGAVRLLLGIVALIFAPLVATGWCCRVQGESPRDFRVSGKKILSLLAFPGINTHFHIHISTNTCVVKLGGEVFNPHQVPVMISALHILVLTVKSPDWPPVDTLLLCCCGCDKIVISPTQQG